MSANAPARCALIVLDGLGDRPIAELGDRTPLEAAATPNLDRLAAAGLLGEIVVVGPGVAPESDAGVLALLGYDPIRDSPGRGVLEAKGAGVPLELGDVALRLNFATLDGDGRIIDSRVGRSLTTSEASQLAEALTRADLLSDLEITASVRATVGHRGVLGLHPTDGSFLSAEVSNADPFYDRVGGLGQARRVAEPRIREVAPLTAAPEPARTARAINAFVARAPSVLTPHRVNGRRALGGRPVANAVLLRNAGMLRPEPLARFEARTGVRGVAVTEMPVERGIALELGMADEFVGPMGPDRELALRERAERVRKALAEYGFVYAHLKGPDEPGHDGDPARKQSVIEEIDRSFFGPFVDGFDPTVHRVAVTADHGTPCALRGHSDDPVPLLLVGTGPSNDRGAGPTKFGESACSRGPLGRMASAGLLPLLLGQGPGTTG